MKISTTTRDGATYITISGEFDSLEDPRSVLEKIASQGPKKMVVDLGELAPLDERNAERLARLLEPLRSTGGTVELTNLRAQPRSVFKVLGVEVGAEVEGPYRRR